MRPESLIGSGQRQQWLLAGMELLIDRIEDESRHRVVRHQRRQLENSAPAEGRDGSRERLRTNLLPSKELPAEVDDQRLFLSQSGSGLPAPDDVDDLRVEAFLEGGRLVRRPLELVVQLPRRHENRQLGQAPIERGLETEVLVGRDRKSTRLNSSHLVISY